MDKNEFFDLILTSVRREALKKLVFSRPVESEITKVSCRLCAHRAQRILAMEYSLPGNTVSQKNLPESSLSELLPLFDQYGQINLITTLGDAEWKRNKKGSEVVLGGDALKRKLSGEQPNFVSAIEALDRKKNYLLSGEEEFLKRLGISSKDGRVHDKKQGKFRQINRFLEHIEDVYAELPKEGELKVYDLCCGKSYLSFAVYYYLTERKGRVVKMIGVDLKRDVIDWCSSLAVALGYSGMSFFCDDIMRIPLESEPDMVISLHACDIATDIVIDKAAELSAKVILSTPCCHNYLNSRINSPELSFVTELPHLRGKLCEAITDGIRVARLKSKGYAVSALELTDPENTPKNTLIRAIKRKKVKEEETESLLLEYNRILSFVLGDKKDEYLKDLTK